MEKSQSGFREVLFDKRYRVFWHVLFWVMVYMDQILSIFGITPGFEKPMLVVMGFLLDVVIVYFNLYVLVPTYLMKDKIVLYLLFTVLMISIILMYNYYAYPFPAELIDDPEYGISYMIMENIVDVLGNTYMLGMAVAIKLFKSIYHKDKRIQEITEEKLRTELGFLRNQVNPHFLFNTMNSFYIQAKKKDDALPDAIMSLSDLLRYQIYETEKEYVSVESEIEYIKNYLDLENNRRDNLDININASGVSKQIKIAPLLLLPLVENAVKYSQRTDGKRAIINLEIEIKDKISFSIINTKGKVSQIKSPDSGVGLNNLTKRLELIYPDDHQYVFSDTADTYTSSLILGKR